MNNFFKHNDKVYMEIHPAKALLNSKLIKETVESPNAIFAVDMNTGEFTIVRKKPVEDPEFMVYFRDELNNVHLLSRILKEALRELCIKKISGNEGQIIIRKKDQDGYYSNLTHLKFTQSSDLTEILDWVTNQYNYYKIA